MEKSEVETGKTQKALIRLKQEVKGYYDSFFSRKSAAPISILLCITMIAVQVWEHWKNFV
ncbi:MAG: hypothetical protein NWF04_00330 [Candidatus Bathyarchaeota archaeon]|nr:hypothetical protein [Candidatus Bathyarchaeota archaeon]